MGLILSTGDGINRSHLCEAMSRGGEPVPPTRWKNYSRLELVLTPLRDTPRCLPSGLPWGLTNFRVVIQLLLL